MKKAGFILALSIVSVMLFSSVAIAEKKVMPRNVESVSEIARCARAEAKHNNHIFHLNHCMSHHHSCTHGFGIFHNLPCGIIKERCGVIESAAKKVAEEVKHCKNVR